MLVQNCPLQTHESKKFSATSSTLRMALEKANDGLGRTPKTQVNVFLKLGEAKLLGN